jgi:acyl-CoA synthetase (AMP-forming)/AMP-acid ligase II
MAGLLVGDVFANAARAVPNRVAAALGDETITFGELDVAANRTGRALAARGVKPGDRVVVVAATRLDVIPVFAAVAKLGAVFAPANTLLAHDEAVEMTMAAQPDLVLADDERAGLSDAVDVPVATLSRLCDEAARESDWPSTVPALSEHDPHVVFFTSGSTGRSKGAVISHRVSYLRTHPGALLEPRGPMVCPYPLFHMGAWTIALQQWQARDRVVFVERADAAAILDAVERHRATRLNCVPAVWRRILDLAGEEPRRETGSVRFADTGTSATPPDLLASIRATVPNAAVRVFYGSTETGAATMLADADIDRKPGSAGAVAPFTTIRIAEDGELQVRGPQVFERYDGDPEATAAAFTPDGWYRTGDLARQDDEGYVTIVGRVGNVIRTGGEAVVPDEVEAVLQEHPAVADVAAVGLPDTAWGEVVCAVVVPAGGAAAPTVDDLAAHCDGRLARFKRPRRVVVVDEIPRTASTGQVQRRLIVEGLTGQSPVGGPSGPAHGQ